jgi:hypothetical protein
MVAIEPAHIVAPIAGESKASAMCMVIFPCSVTLFILVARFMFLSSYFMKNRKDRNTSYYLIPRENNR